MATPNVNPISVASFRSDTFNYDSLLAGECISQSANIAGSLGVLKRGQVLFGPVAPAPITAATLLTTVPTGASARVILAQDIDTTGGQVTGLVYTQGKFCDTAMIFSSNGAASDAASLWDYGVYVLTVENRSGKLVPMMGLPATGGALPQTSTLKEAKDALEQEVKAIKGAERAAYPLEPVEPLVSPHGTQPAWAIAAFGETKPTPLEQAEEKAAEKGGELYRKHAEEREKLRAEHAEQLGDLAEKHAKERESHAKQSAESIAHAQPRDEREGETKHTPPPAPPHAPPKK